MKNLLEFEIYSATQHINSLYIQSQYEQALSSTDKALQTFYENVALNETIRKNYECAIFSIRGLIQTKLGNKTEAHQSFNNAIKLNPNHFVTLLRRSRFLVQIDCIEQAICDIEKILFEHPQSKQIRQIIENVKSKILLINNENQKDKFLKHINQLLQCKNKIDEQDLLLDEQSKLSFYNLRNIDKQSVQKQFQRKSIRTSSAVLNHSQMLKEPDQLIKNKRNSLAPIIIQKKKRRKFATSYLSSCSVDSNQQFSSNFGIFQSQQDPKDVQKQGQTSEKISRRNSSVRFIDQQNTTIKQVPKTKTAKRQSCLRASQLTIQSQNLTSQQLVKGNQREFGKLKSIDIELPKNQGQDNNLIVNNQPQSDEENNEHNIFNSNNQDIQVLRCLNNLDKIQRKRSEKKKSILRKNSTGSISSRKSVTFEVLAVDQQ